MSTVIFVSERCSRSPVCLVSATDAARVLAIGRTTLYEIVKSGDLTPIHIRRCVRFSMYEIRQYVESLTRGLTHAA